MKAQALKEQMKTVELTCAPGGFGFTLSGQAPCVLSCVLPGSPAHKVDLKPGDQIIEVNGSFVKELPHDQVVKLITQSSNGVVQLTVQKPSNSFGKSYTKMQTDVPISNDEEEINKNILNRVDKVVEELKSGQLFVQSNTAVTLSFPNGHFISEREIASDEELKASLTDSIKGDDSPYSTLNRDKSANEDKKTSDLARHMISTQTENIRSATPVVKSTLSLKPEVEEAKMKPLPILQAVVGYLGSIELPANSNLETASLNEIRSCVRRLRAQQKVQVLFLMEVAYTGVKLISEKGKTIVMYPAKSLAFTGVCSDDSRVFGIVTRKCREEGFQSDSRSVDPESTTNCSCQVFCVDPEIKRHELHIDVAKKFGLSCDHDEGNFICTGFPSSSSSILNAINSLSKEGTGVSQGRCAGSCSNEIESTFPTVRPRTSSSSSSSSVTSQSESCSSAGISERKNMSKGKVKIRHPSVNTVPIESTYSVDTSGGSTEFEAPHKRKQKQANNGNLSENKEKINSHVSEKIGVKPAMHVETKKGERYEERTDSGVGSDSLNLANDSEVIVQNCYYNGSSMTPPTFNVSTFHSRNSSIDSQMSLGSHHSSLTDQGIMSDTSMKRWIQPVTGTVRYPVTDQSSQFYVTVDHEVCILGYLVTL